MGKNNIGIVKGTIITVLLPIINHFISEYILRAQVTESDFMLSFYVSFGVYGIFCIPILSIIVGFFMKYRFINKITGNMTVRSKDFIGYARFLVSTLLSVFINALIPFMCAFFVEILLWGPFPD